MLQSVVYKVLTVLKDSASVSRRSRLSILRGKMQKEFGGILQSNLTSLEDETGSTSGSASLASWGRNLIMEHSALTVGPFFPADSISTKAFSMNECAANDNARYYFVSFLHAKLLFRTVYL